MWIRVSAVKVCRRVPQVVVAVAAQAVIFAPACLAYKVLFHESLYTASHFPGGKTMLEVKPTIAIGGKEGNQ